MWARSLGSHAYFGGLFSLEEWEIDENVDYAVFDDIQGGFKFFPAYKSWLGNKLNSTVLIGTGRKKNIFSGASHAYG